MCNNCKTSPLGIQRQAELNAATEACKALNLNVATAGFISRHAYRGGIPNLQRGMIRFSKEEQAALDRYNAAQQAIKDLHWEIARRNVEEARERGIKTFYIAHGDRRQS